MPVGSAKVCAGMQMHANEAGGEVLGPPLSPDPPARQCPEGAQPSVEEQLSWAPREQLQGPSGLPCLTEPHHVAGLDVRPQQGLAPGAAAREPDAAIGKNCFTI